jgi:hypothetical protein
MLQKDDKDAQIEFLKERILKIKGMLDKVFVEEIPMYDGYSDEYEPYYEVGGIGDVKDLCDKTLMEVTF